VKKVNWKKVREQFEKDLAFKLLDLPGHRDVPENLRKFRNLISHQLPETAPLQIFRKLIKLLLEEKPVNLVEISKEYLGPLLKKEKQILEKHGEEFEGLKKEAKRWVKESLPEEKLRRLWKEHKTWLPRRYTIYKGRKVSLQRIVADTLARYVLIKTLPHPPKELSIA